jgi:hypothetical protein
MLTIPNATSDVQLREVSEKKPKKKKKKKEEAM